MGPIGVLIIILLGIVVPLTTIIGLPLRAMYRIIVGSWGERFVWGCLLVPWGYFLVPIFQHGYVSVQSTQTAPHFEGPTVDPRVWLGLGICWFLVEVVRKGSGKTLAQRPQHKSQSLIETTDRQPSASVED